MTETNETQGQGAAPRAIVAGLYLSLDGVADSPAASAFTHNNPELSAAMAAGLARADALLLGPRTYHLFAQIWRQPGVSGAMAEFFNSAPKYVVSHTAQSLEWPPATLLTGDVTAALTQLKQQPGGAIQVPGSPRLVRWLLQAGLLDELSLVICPVVVGAGLRLFDGLSGPLYLQLVEARGYANGAVGVMYRRGAGG